MWGDILSTVIGVQCRGGYHEYHGDYLEYWGDYLESRGHTQYRGGYHDEYHGKKSFVI